MATFWIPVGVNFADGVTALPSQPYGSGGTPTVVGTPLPTGYINIFSSLPDGTPTNLVTIQEQSGSPVIEKAEQATCQHTLKMDWQACLNYFSLMDRGTILSDSFANIWRVLSVTATRTEATTGLLSYTMESISFDTPPDDFSLNEVSLDLNIIKHPRYAWALNPYISDNSTYTVVGDTNIYYTDIKEAIIRMIQNYIDSPFYPSAAQVQGLIQSNILAMLNLKAGQTAGVLQINYANPNYVQPNGSSSSTAPVTWDGTNASLAKIPTSVQFLLVSVPFNLSNPADPITVAVAAAKELISKLWRQEDTPYIAGYEVVWTQYFFAPVYLNPGGYVEDPRLHVPQYFISPSNNGIIPRGYINPGVPGFGFDTSSPPSSGQSTIFDYLSSVNPQCYSTTGIVGGPLSFSCLRKSDHYDYERTWFKVPHTWLCAPIGKWDSDLYNQNNRPQNANDYNNLPNSFGS